MLTSSSTGEILSALLRAKVNFQPIEGLVNGQWRRVGLDPADNPGA